jgi:hypothetical protein
LYDIIALAMELWRIIQSIVKLATERIRRGYLALTNPPGLLLARASGSIQTKNSTIQKMKLCATAASSAILALVLVSHGSDVQAFAPVGPVSAAQTGTKTSFATSRNVAEAHRRTSTSLAMKGNLVDRFVRVFNANINKIVSGLEDPEKVIVQAVDDMQVSNVYDTLY